MMWSKEIVNKLKHIKHFGGVYALDQLPINVKFPIGIIINTDPQDQPGSHWVAIYIDSDGIGEYFDSYGLPPLNDEFYKFLFNNCPNGYFYNNITLQCIECVTCGKYCVAYLICRLYKNISCAYFVSLFTSNPEANDTLIKFYYNLIK
jgi:hypothetical protein